MSTAILPSNEHPISSPERFHALVRRRAWTPAPESDVVVSTPPSSFRPILVRLLGFALLGAAATGVWSMGQNASFRHEVRRFATFDHADRIDAARSFVRSRLYGHGK